MDTPIVTNSSRASRRCPGELSGIREAYCRSCRDTNSALDLASVNSEVTV